MLEALVQGTTDPEVLAKIPSLLKAEVESRGHRYVNAWLKGFGPSSIDFNLVFDDRARDFDSRAMNKSAICVGILKTFKEQGIEFAYPTQTTFTAAPDGTMVMPYATPGDAKR